MGFEMLFAYETNKNCALKMNYVILLYLNDYFSNLSLSNEKSYEKICAMRSLVQILKFALE